MRGNKKRPYRARHSPYIPIGQSQSIRIFLEGKRQVPHHVNVGGTAFS